jgi:hypothetical protein
MEVKISAELTSESARRNDQVADEFLWYHKFLEFPVEGMRPLLHYFEIEARRVHFVYSESEWARSLANSMELFAFGW